MSEMMQKYIEEAEKALLHTYNRYQIVLDKGDGVYLYDIDGKKYLDFVSGIAVSEKKVHRDGNNKSRENGKGCGLHKAVEAVEPYVY